MSSNVTEDQKASLKALFAEFDESLTASAAEEARRSELIKAVIAIGGKGPYLVHGKTLLATSRKAKDGSVTYYFRGQGVDVPLAV